MNVMELLCWSNFVKTQVICDHRTAGCLVLMENYLGFRIGYLRQFAFRQFRCAVSVLGEASTILQTFPDAKHVSEGNLSKHLRTVIMLYHGFCDNRLKNVHLSNPVLDTDTDMGAPNLGFFTIFNAWEHDPGLAKRTTCNVVVDGNKVMTRLLQPDELAFKKRGSGRPNQKKQERRMKLGSRCGGAKNPRETEADRSLKRTEGIYVTVDMETHEVLHVAEMLNAERMSYRTQAATELNKYVNVATLCVDVGCVMAKSFEGIFCRNCLLDSWHALKHKCDKKKYDPKHPNNARLVKHCNSEAAEQLFSRTDKLASFCIHLKRQHYRLFLKRYFAWRNKFVRSGLRLDSNPCRSRKTHLKRSRANRRCTAQVAKKLARRA